ncbi:alpha/beta fold hydrolase [Methylobacterium oryzisoli]|uniref:alpha/beta fold hydrolase n=1 Tax=Methylobacterium oryzisoli TaxID=3385502 RepID=UPI003891ADD8
MPARMIATTHGRLAVDDRGGTGRPLLLIHGNSSCRRVFARQWDSRLRDLCRLITLDLPGHGESDDASAPARSYTRAGLADAVFETIASLGLERVVVLGWSLGGHIAIEMLTRAAGIEGLVIAGAPPVRRGGMAEGFLPSSHLASAGRRSLSPVEMTGFARAIFGEPVEPFLLHAIARADGRCRERLFQDARAGHLTDQRLTVESSPVPIAVINGAADPLINLDYIDGVAFRNLWSGRCHRLHAGHAPFWHASDACNALVARFLDDLRAGTAL